MKLEFRNWKGGGCKKLERRRLEEGRGYEGF